MRIEAALALGAEANTNDRSHVRSCDNVWKGTAAVPCTAKRRRRVCQCGALAPHPLCIGHRRRRRRLRGPYPRLALAQRPLVLRLQCRHGNSVLRTLVLHSGTKLLRGRVAHVRCLCFRRLLRHRRRLRRRVMGYQIGGAQRRKRLSMLLASLLLLHTAHIG